jgi:uncharacterized protein
MRIDNAFHVTLPVEDTWTLLTDLPRVAPCLPGARLDDVVDGEYRGGLATRIGPINAHYSGAAWFLERDEVDHRAVIQARGREARGSGSASATVTATLRPEGDGTRVEVSTELSISGRAAQFGRSLLAEVSSTLIGQFVTRLESLIHGDGESESTQAAATADDSLDVGATLVVPMLRRAAVPLVAAVAGAVIGALIARRGCPRSSTPALSTASVR